jgi:hypothetical protein
MTHRVCPFVENANNKVNCLIEATLSPQFKTR